jgi:cell division protein FtsL
MASLMQRRRDLLTMSQPMAIPLSPPAAPPIGTRLAALVQRLLALAQTRTVRRILMWTLVSFAVCALGGVYLLETSHVASLASQRASLEATTTALNDANARLRAQAAGAQTFAKTEQIARASGMREPPASAVAYVTLPDVTEPPPRATPAPAPKPGLMARIRNALTGHAAAAGGVAAPQPTPGARP